MFASTSHSWRSGGASPAVPHDEQSVRAERVGAVAGFARRIGFSGHAEVSHHSVYCFDHARIGGQPSTLRAGVAVVGQAPMAWCDPRRYCVRAGEAYQRFLDKFAVFGSRLSQQHRVSVFSTDTWFDADTLAELAERIMAAPDTVRTNLLARPRVDAIDGLLDAMSTMDCVVSCRFHGVIFAHLPNIPVIVTIFLPSAR